MAQGEPSSLAQPAASAQLRTPHLPHLRRLLRARSAHRPVASAHGLVQRDIARSVRPVRDLHTLLVRAAEPLPSPGRDIERAPAALRIGPIPRPHLAWLGWRRECARTAGFPSRYRAGDAFGAALLGDTQL